MKVCVFYRHQKFGKDEHQRLTMTTTNSNNKYEHRGQMMTTDNDEQ